jgi:signal peptidase I
VPGLGHLYDGYLAAAALAYLVAMAGLASMLGIWLFVPLAPANIVLGLFAFPGVYLAVAVHAALLARRRGATYELRPYNRWYVYLAAYVVLGFVLYPRFQQWLKRYTEAFRIPSGAMEPTLLIGDYLYVTKGSAGGRGLTNGSIAVFESVEEPGLKVIKRVVGLPGDSVSMRSGNLWRNGERVSEGYVVHRNPGRSEDPAQRAKMRAWQLAHRVEADSGLYAPDLQDWGPLVVPPDSFLALGDNRDASYDSRYYGFVPFTKIIGQPRVIYLSLDRVKGDASNGAVRWSRIGQRVQ